MRQGTEKRAEVRATEPHKSSHSPDGTVQIIRRSTSEKSLGGDYSKGRFKQRLGRGTTTGCKRIRQRSHYWTIRTATIEAKSQGRPPVRLAETHSCTVQNATSDNLVRRLRRPSSAIPQFNRECKSRGKQNTTARETCKTPDKGAGMQTVHAAREDISRRTNLHRSS